MHIIFTRVGLEHVGFIWKNNIKRVENYCNLWLKHSSKFYTSQTKDVPFMVAIQYDLCYEKIIKSFDWPPWAVLAMHKRMFPFVQKKHEELVGKRVCISRLDADDSYAIDFFEALEKEPSGLVLHKRFKQYNTLTGELTDEMFRAAPHFSTMVWDKFPSDLEELKFNMTAVRNKNKGEHRYSYIKIDDNHTYIRRHEHRVLDGCFCLERVTGYNCHNSWKYSKLIKSGEVKAATNPVKSSKVLDSRFVGY